MVSFVQIVVQFVFKGIERFLCDESGTDKQADGVGGGTLRHNKRTSQGGGQRF